MIRKTVIPVVFFLSLLISYSFFSFHVTRMRQELPPSYARAEALMVSPDLLDIISGEFRGLVSDYLVLKAAYFLGGYYHATSDDWEAVTTLFEQAIRLENHFFTPTYYAQGILVWRDHVVRRDVEMIAICHRARNWDWEPGFYAGFDYYNFLNDVERAIHYLNESAVRPKALPLVSYLAARYAEKINRTEAAIVMLQMLHERTKNELVKEEVAKRMRGYQDLLVFEKGIERYQGRYGVNPSSLNDLVDKHILPVLPQNPPGFFFSYDPETGNVSLN